MAIRLTTLMPICRGGVYKPGDRPATKHEAITASGRWFCIVRDRASYLLSVMPLAFFLERHSRFSIGATQLLRMHHKQ